MGILTKEEIIDLDTELSLANSLYTVLLAHKQQLNHVESLKAVTSRAKEELDRAQNVLGIGEKLLEDKLSIVNNQRDKLNAHYEKIRSKPSILPLPTEQIEDTRLDREVY